MKLYRNIKLSTKALLINRSRTMFSILGMAVGITAVIVTVAIGEGAKQKALKPIKAMGTNVLLVNSGKVKTVFGRKKQILNVTTLKLKDVEILSEIEGIQYISPFQEQRMKIKYQDVTTSSLVQGISAEYLLIRNYGLNSGEIFSEEDNKLAKKVAVLGSDVANSLFGKDNAIDQTILINRISFTVIAVLNQKGLGAELGNIDNVVMVPVNTALRRLYNLNYLNKIYIGVDEMENLEVVEKEVTEVLRVNHRLESRNKEDDFTLINQVNEIKASEETAAGFNSLIIGVAAISLLIGGIGILALMILSVKERINEIGLRKSIGAKKKNIIVQFLSEALIMGFAGGIGGIIFGISASYVLNIHSEWDTSILWQAVLISFVFSMFTALIFGVYPAWQAARLDPIEALQAE